jgi:UDP-glucose 4-epimerase
MSPLKVVVTGANGFIGQHVCKHALMRGCSVIRVGRSLDPSGFVDLDLRFNELTDDNFPSADVLVHLAAINNTLSHDEEVMQRINVQDSINLFNIAASKSIKAIVYASSIHVYGDVPSPLGVATSTPRPLTPYGRSKLALERAAAAFSADTGVACIGLRLANVYGPGELHKGLMASQVTQLAQQMKKGRPVLFEPGSQVRDFVYVDDVATAVVESAFCALAGCSTILNCGSGVGVTFNDLVRLLNLSLGLGREPEYIPEPANYLKDIVLDIGETKAKLGWNPRAIDVALESYLSSGSK